MTRKNAQKAKELSERAMDDRRMAISELIRQGIRNQNEIVRRLAADHGIETSAPTVSRDLKAMEEVYKESARGAIEKERGIALMRCEGMIARLHEKLQRYDRAIENEDAKAHELESDLPTIRLLKEWEERRSKLLGLDMPSKIAHTDPSGEEEYSGIPKSFKERFFRLHGRPQEEEPEEIVVDHEPVRELE
jgi:hypothetical protein